MSDVLTSQQGFRPSEPPGAPVPEELHVVGGRVRAADAIERVSGRARFAVDVEVPGMLHAKVLRSTSPHARIVSLDVSAAERAPGVVAVLCGRDLADPSIRSHYGPIFADRPIVAIDRVRYVGEPVAVVIATEKEAAADALELIEVEYEELPAYFDPDAAMAPDAIPLHSGTGDRDFVTFPDLVLNPEVGSNVLNHFRIRRGDIERGLAEADEIFEGTYRTPGLQHVSLEPHVTICQIKNGVATLWTSASSPFTARFQVAETLRLPQSRVQVIVENIGGAYGGKSYPRHEPLVAAASWRVGGRPVRLELTRAEEFATICRHAAVVRLTTGVRRDGTIVARRVDARWSAGAYADISPRVVKNGGYASIGPYRVPHVHVDSYAVYTNVTPAGGFRGYGVPQVSFAYESQLDEIAYALGIEPLELRRRNLMVDGDLFSTGQVMTDLHYHELLDSVSKVGDGSRPARRPAPSSSAARPRTARGRGFAVAAKGTVTPSTSTATLRLEPDGSLVLLAGTTEVGQGARTVLTQLAADAARVSHDRVMQVQPDTQTMPWDQTTSSSRSTMLMGGAIQRAAANLHDQLRALAEEALDVPRDQVEIVLDGVRAGDRTVSFAELLRVTGVGNVLASGRYATEGHLDSETGLGVATSALFQGAAGAEVEVDLETGKVTVLDMRVAVWAGRTVHPTLAELQCEGNVAFGVSAALFEEMVISDGQIANASLADYMITSFEDMPEHLSVHLAEAQDPDARLYGVGESALPPVAPAIANAVRDACGVRIDNLPVTPEKVLRALREVNADPTTARTSL